MFEQKITIIEECVQ